MFDAIDATTRSRVAAASAVRGHDYVCPIPFCGMAVRLRAGQCVDAHYAHSDASPGCPRYQAKQGGVWNRGDPSTALCLVDLGGGDLEVLSCDPISRLSVTYDGNTSPANLNPEYEHKNFAGPTHDWMLFSRRLHGTRVRLKEYVFEDDDYWLVGRANMRPPIPVRQVRKIGTSWLVYVVESGREDLRILARSLGLHVAKPRVQPNQRSAKDELHHALMETDVGSLQLELCGASSALLSERKLDVALAAPVCTFHVAMAGFQPKPSATRHVMSKGRLEEFSMVFEAGAASVARAKERLGRPVHSTIRFHVTISHDPPES